MGGVRKSFLLSLLDSYLGVALQLAGTVIVSRLLSPAEVGIFAIASVFSAMASTFRDFGVAEYMIQERELSEQKIRAALALNILISWAVALALAALAPMAAGFYGETGVRNVMLVLALNFVLVPFGAVTMAFFRRNLDYRPIVIANAASSVVAFVVVIWLALLGWGYMSLAWSSLAGIVVSVLAAAWYRPAGFPRRPALAGMNQVFQFGKFASGIYIFARIGKGAPELIIGKTGGPADVGIFSRANGLVEIFNRLLLRPVMQVCLPYFAQSDRHSGTVVPAYVKSVSMLTAVGWPFLGVMAVAAFSAIRVIYGAQWVDAVDLARVLCLAMAIELMSALSREAMLARGEARRANALQVQISAAQVLGLLAAIPFGLMGACWGLVAAAFAGAVLSQWHLRACIGLSLRDMAQACRGSVGLTVLTVGPLALAAAFVPPSEANFGRWGVAAACASVATWLLALRLLSHPLWFEITATTARIFKRA